MGSAGVPHVASHDVIGTVLDRMPAELESSFALSAAPPALRARTTLYLLDPQTGYYKTREGTSGVTCLVERTDWALGEFRDDIYIPICFDAAGTATYLKVIMEVAALRARGMSAADLKAEVTRRYKVHSYRPPTKSGVSYMEAPVFRTSTPDLQVRTMSAPHVMFYAPFVTNGDIGASTRPGDHAGPLQPFVDRTGDGEESYIIQLIGDAEKAVIVTREKPLLEALCAYRDVLCVK
jgi:hypothetical protein